MTHPHLLHLRAAAWSLNAARGALAQRAREEAEQIAAELAQGANDGLRSSVMGVRNGGGGHGDPVSGVALSGLREPRPNRFQQLADNVTSTLGWLADTLGAPPASDPLLRLNALTPLPGTAATLTRWLTENDQRIRTTLTMSPNLWAVPGSPECPGCKVRSLYVQTAAPSDLWTVICRAGCLCSGQGCRCDMPIKVEGVAHIWDRSAPFLADALTTTAAAA